MCVCVCMRALFNLWASFFFLLLFYCVYAFFFFFFVFEYNGKKWRIWHIIFYLFSIGCCILCLRFCSIIYEKMFTRSLVIFYIIFVCALTWSEVTDRRWMMMIGVCMSLFQLYYFVHLNVYGENCDLPKPHLIFPFAQSNQTFHDTLHIYIIYTASMEYSLSKNPNFDFLMLLSFAADFATQTHRHL